VVAGGLDLLLLLDLHQVHLVKVLLLLGRGCGRDRPRFVAQLPVGPVQLDCGQQVLKGLVLFVEERRQVVVTLRLTRIGSTLWLQRAVLRQGELTAHSYS